MSFFQEVIDVVKGNFRKLATFDRWRRGGNEFLQPVITASPDSLYIHKVLQEVSPPHRWYTMLLKKSVNSQTKVDLFGFSSSPFLTLASIEVICISKVLPNILCMMYDASVRQQCTGNQHLVSCYIKRRSIKKKKVLSLQLRFIFFKGTFSIQWHTVESVSVAVMDFIYLFQLLSTLNCFCWNVHRAFTSQRQEGDS